MLPSTCTEVYVLVLVALSYPEIEDNQMGVRGKEKWWRGIEWRMEGGERGEGKERREGKREGGKGKSGWGRGEHRGTEGNDGEGKNGGGRVRETGGGIIMLETTPTWDSNLWSALILFSPSIVGWSWTMMSSVIPLEFWAQRVNILSSSPNGSWGVPLVLGGVGKVGGWEGGGDWGSCFMATWATAILVWRAR